ncbi:hypothetical protein RYX36_009413, partial [Vicia faba]
DSIELFDTDTEESYDCELGEHEGRVQKYLCSGWYEFVNDCDLSEGDVLTFYIWYPPTTRILTWWVVIVVVVVAGWGVRYIDIVDSETGDSYECEVHTFERNHRTEKFLGHGWNKFAKNKRLRNGNHVGFNIRYPPVREIVATLLKH